MVIATLWLWLEQSEGERAGKARRDWNILCGQQETEDPVKVSQARDRGAITVCLHSMAPQAFTSQVHRRVKRPA